MQTKATEVVRKLIDLEFAARKGVGDETFRVVGRSREADINGKTVRVSIVCRYHNPAQRFMYNAQWALDGKRISYSKLVVSLS